MRLVHTPSHLISVSPICEALVDRGHEVVVLTSDRNLLNGLTREAYSRTIKFDTDATEGDVQASTDNLAKMISGMQGKSVVEIYRTMRLMRSNYAEACGSLFSDDGILRILREESFDMVLTLSVSGCDILLAVCLEVPFTIHTPVNRYPIITEDHFGIPVPVSYVPFSLFTAMTDSMSFIERVGNFVLRFVVHPVFEWFLTRPLVPIKEEQKIRPDLSLRQLTGLADLWLCSADFAIEFAHPTAPMWIPIGGITYKEPSPLPHVSPNHNERNNVC